MKREISSKARNLVDGAVKRDHAVLGSLSVSNTKDPAMIDGQEGPRPRGEELTAAGRRRGEQTSFGRESGRGP